MFYEENILGNKMFKEFFSFASKNIIKLYSKEEVKNIKESFWTSLGRYLSLIPADEDSKVNWINYKTGIKYLRFRMDANTKSGIIAIEITHPDLDLRLQILDQFKDLALILESEIGEKWEWDMDYQDDFGRPIIRIYKEVFPANVLNKEDWPKLISFFKPRIIGLHNFWSTAKYSFEKFKYV